MLADEDQLPGLSEERPAVVGEERQQDDVHHQLHHEQPPEHGQYVVGHSLELETNLREV